MHTRLCDAARTSTCYREPQDDGLRPARGIVYGLLGSVVFWLLVWASLV